MINYIDKCFFLIIELILQKNIHSTSINVYHHLIKNANKESFFQFINNALFKHLIFIVLKNNSY